MDSRNVRSGVARVVTVIVAAGSIGASQGVFLNWINQPLATRDGWYFSLGGLVILVGWCWLAGMACLDATRPEGSVRIWRAREPERTVQHWIFSIEIFGGIVAFLTSGLLLLYAIAMADGRLAASSEFGRQVFVVIGWVGVICVIYTAVYFIGQMHRAGRKFKETKKA